MAKILTFSNEDILHHIKITCQIPNLLEAIATHKIIADKALEAGIKINPEELQQAADSLRLANQLLKAEDTWAWLEKYYLSVDDFEELAQINLISNKLATHLFGEKVEPFFYDNQINYTSAVIYEVILDDEGLALELFYALQEGEINFQEIARQYIQNPEIRRAGGYQGIKRRHDFHPEIAAAVFAANPPQLLKPIITAKGAHLISVEEIIKPQLDEQLRGTILGDLFTAWLKQQLEQFEIVVQLDVNSNHSTEKLKSQSSQAA
ncbi:peptidylprolyl isomerase [Nostoc sp. FACHB-152]|uniref:peptidylprolyl isomerase n=1 Tax=unclassified Nostoc TaxID=2593658 RepID=UPI0016858A7D|nr:MULTISPECIES: peptidylprolyl isomerase [unclassified Nostoc]MBD2448163.1 peptidylprolyl isomerase [Nostoc sp. FACHB-152]MBD2470560.1 peptidylprolyl isomerase [Nostoc sp. FACHB-145]